jgi:hypothetical protein
MLKLRRTFHDQVSTFNRSLAAGVCRASRHSTDRRRHPVRIFYENPVEADRGSLEQHVVPARYSDLGIDSCKRRPSTSFDVSLRPFQ